MATNIDQRIAEDTNTENKHATKSCNQCDVMLYQTDSKMNSKRIANSIQLIAQCNHGYE